MAEVKDFVLYFPVSLTGRVLEDYDKSHFLV